MFWCHLQLCLVSFTFHVLATIFVADFFHDMARWTPVLAYMVSLVVHQIFIYIYVYMTYIYTMEGPMGILLLCLVGLTVHFLAKLVASQPWEPLWFVLHELEWRRLVVHHRFPAWIACRTTVSSLRCIFLVTYYVWRWITAFEIGV